MGCASPRRQIVIQIPKGQMSNSFERAESRGGGGGGGGGGGVGGGDERVGRGLGGGGNGALGTGNSHNRSRVGNELPNFSFVRESFG